MVKSASPEPFPGSAATSADILPLADAYRQAAISLIGDRRHVLSQAPAALCAIHAREIRSYSHDLAIRGGIAVERGLILRRRTVDHLAKMTHDREYLISRYGPENLYTLSQVNRLMATMNEIGRKVACHVERPASVLPDPCADGSNRPDACSGRASGAA